MKPEPLKEKGFIVYSDNGYVRGTEHKFGYPPRNGKYYHEEDVKSALEWLKIAIFAGKDRILFSDDAKKVVLETIEEASPDVVD